MNELSKSIFHKIKDSRYATRYFVGQGVDIGAGQDALGLYSEFFPLMTACRAWDLEDGDAQYMETVPSGSLDFVHSSHCLEHMVDPRVALFHWLRILKPGGHMFCLVPDEDMYEQGVFPSTFNADHKHTFTVFKKASWCANSINLFDLLATVPTDIEILKIERLDATFRYKLNQALGLERFDQTLTPIGECAIDFVVRKLGG